MMNSVIVPDVALLKVESFASASKDQQYIVTLRDKHFEVSEPVAELIESLKNNKSLEELASELSQKKNRTYTIGQVEEIIARFIQPIFEETETKSPFLFNREIIPTQTIKPLTAIFSNLFRPVIAWPLTITILAVLCYFLQHSTFQYHASGYAGLQGIIVFGGLSFASILFHELGHAAACRYYGVEHGHIGIGVYLHLPVFYADVSNVWKLKRTQRVVVDLAGIYFQLIFLVPVAAAYFYSNSIALEYLVYATIISFLFDLNPFLKLDGYWLCSDLLGIANLRKRTIEILTYGFDRLKGKQGRELPYLFKIQPLEKWAFVVYTVLVNIFFAYFLFYAIPKFILKGIDTLPAAWSTILDSTNPLPLIFGFVTQVFFFGLVIFFVGRTAFSLVNFIRKNIL